MGRGVTAMVDFDFEEDDFQLCPVCGAYSPRQCEMREETEGECPWELMSDEEDAL